MKQKKFFIYFFYLILSFSLFAERFSELEIEDLYQQMHLNNKISFKAFEQAMQGMNEIENRNSNVLTIVDFTKPSNENRLFVLDIDNKEIVLSSLVSHGMRTGDVYAKSFSNRAGTSKSSNGFFMTGEIYNGKNGYSLRLYGLEPGRNNNAYARTIVIHAATYADETFLKKYGRLGRSKGCLAVPPRKNVKLIDSIHGGNVCYVHSEGLDYQKFVFQQ